MSAADRVLKEIERRAGREYLPIIGQRKGRVLAEAVREARPRRVLEVGTLIGYSAILIARELDREAELIVIEIHEDEAVEAEENIRRAEVPPSVKILVGDAVEVIPRLDGSFDLVFFDAEKREYMDYLRLVEERLHEGSVVVVDNAGIFAVQLRGFLDYVRRSGKYRSRYVPVGGDGLEISVKQ